MTEERKNTENISSRFELRGGKTLGVKFLGTRKKDKRNRTKEYQVAKEEEYITVTPETIIEGKRITTTTEERVVKNKRPVRKNSHKEKRGPRLFVRKKRI